MVIIWAIVSGERDPQQLAGLRHARRGQDYLVEDESVYEERHRHRTLAYLTTTAMDLAYHLVPAPTLAVSVLVTCGLSLHGCCAALSSHSANQPS